MAAISFQSVSKSYPSPRSPDKTFLALDRVSLDIEQGEFFGLLGPNGAGKTTMISILAGLSRASSGSVSVLGSDVVRDFAQARRSLGVVPQELLDSLGLADKANANTRQLSGGMKRRLLVAQALVHKPPVIVLDEPTAGVDVELRQTLWKFIARLNRQGHTVLLTTHYLEEAEALCGRVAMLKTGRVVALERTSELLKAASSNVLRFKVDAELPEELASRARITGRIVQFPAHDALEIERYLAAVREAGLQAQDVEIRKADLEDVFVEVMSRNHDVASAHVQ